MKILVTGSAGMLGSGLVPALQVAGHEVVPTDIDLRAPLPWGDGGPRITALDVRDRAAVERAVDDVQPGLVVHLAAETDLEVCENDDEHAYLTNAIGTKHVALACQRRGLPIAYVSTAGVFDGTKQGAYHEYDSPHPINVYGRSKLAGEQYVQWFCERAYVVRAGWMVGGGAKDHKFVARMLGQVRAGSTTLYAVGDKLGTPTYVPDFGRCFAALLAAESYGLYHMACEGVGSRYDVTREILDVLGLREQIALVEVGSEHFAREFPTPRPRSEIMRNLALSLQGLNTMRPWRDALREYLLTHFSDLVSVAVPRQQTASPSSVIDLDAPHPPAVPAARVGVSTGGPS